MKLNRFNLLLIFPCCELFAQDIANLYPECFQRHIIGYHKEKGSEVYLQATVGITEFIPETVLGNSILQLSDKDIANKVKKGNFVMIQIFPIVIENNEIRLDIFEFSVLRKKGQITLIKHGGSSFKIGIIEGKVLHH